MFLAHEWFYSTATRAIAGATVVVVLVVVLLLVLVLVLVGANGVGGTRGVGRCSRLHQWFNALR